VAAPDSRGAGRIIADRSQVFDPQADWNPIVGRARAQHGVITSVQLVEAGMSPSTIATYRRVGRLHRIHQGVYALVPRELLRPLAHDIAAVLACGPGAALSHQSAASLMNLMQSHRTVVDVIVASRAGRRREGIQIHRSSTLRPEDVKPVHGIPCTTPSRTILDLAGVLQRRRLERLLDQAEAEELFDLAGLMDQLTHNAGYARAAVALRRVLDEHRVGSTATDTELEELFLALSREIGLPDPEIQSWLDLGDGEQMIRPDFLWRAQRVIVETDGEHHRNRRRFEEDRRRDQRARAAGFETVRVTKRQLRTEPGRLGRTVRTILADRSGRQALPESQAPGNPAPTSLPQAA
jgi:hypothetical protein